MFSQNQEPGLVHLLQVQSLLSNLGWKAQIGDWTHKHFHYQPRSLNITPHFCVTEEMPRSQQPLQLLCLYQVSLSNHRNSEIWEKLLLLPLQRCLTCVLYQVLASPVSAFTCKCSVYTLIPWKRLFSLSLLISVMVREMEVWETK